MIVTWDPLTQRSTEVGINGNATNSATNFDPMNVYNPSVLLIRATHGVPCQVQMHSRFWTTMPLATPSRAFTGWRVTFENGGGVQIW